MYAGLRVYRRENRLSKLTLTIVASVNCCNGFYNVATSGESNAVKRSLGNCASNWDFLFLPNQTLFTIRFMFLFSDILLPVLNGLVWKDENNPGSGQKCVGIDGFDCRMSEGSWSHLQKTSFVAALGLTVRPVGCTIGKDLFSTCQATHFKKVDRFHPHHDISSANRIASSSSICCHPFFPIPPVHSEAHFGGTTR
ncbi:unnamed protein product [Protopolystoma xenopodis]|uniref:Uncharacterized protein n=1 Tax=Protopolystoma xenopodis TaxID=117903 RepID=A0A448X3A8_9PLAT|nr:unnamed protein product [Protopolystoma xenopodis]